MPDQKGTLYICPTPIGNLEDITFRCLRILKEVNLIAAEDTRITRKLLSHYEISTPFLSYHKYTEKSRSKHIVDELLKGKSIALVSDSGTPVISDPGAELINQAHQNNIPIVPLPGASALSCAVSVAGFVDSGFVFAGFLPKQTSKKKECLNRYSAYALPVVIYESPQRLIATLEAIYEIYGNVLILLAREITKYHEEIIQNNVVEVLKYYKTRDIKGEITIIIDKLPAKESSLDDNQLKAIIRERLDSNETVLTISRELSEEFNIGKNHIYKLALDLLE
jgi:16S rRNA (cytidine1402-2'-O)-methyltransferase